MEEIDPKTGTHYGSPVVRGFHGKLRIFRYENPEDVIADGFSNIYEIQQWLFLHSGSFGPSREHPVWGKYREIILPG